MTDHELTRRSVLRGAAILGGAAASGLGPGILTGAAGAATTHGALPQQVDVVVVGAGISGLVAARQIKRHHRSVLVVEARGRVGGRVLNHHLADGATIESGGAFIGPTQDHIAKLAAELKVPTFLEYNQGQSTYVSSTLGRMTYAGTVPPDPQIAEAALLLQEIDNYAAQISVEAPWTHPRAAEWDAMTLAEWIKANSVNHATITKLIECWTQPGFGADPTELSFLFVLWYVACSGNEHNPGTFERNADTGDGAQQRRFVGGSQLIPKRLAHQLHDRVALHAPVHRIVQRHGHALVHTDRGTVRCKRVIVACPPALVLGIDWHPHLPVRRSQLLEHMTMGNLMKCDAVYETPFWRAAGLNGFGISDHGAVRAAFDNCPQPGRPGVLLAFVGGSTWRKYGLETLPQRRAAVLQGFAEMFGPQALHPIEYVEHDWNHEKWTRGGPVAIMGPGTMTGFGPALRRPFHRVHWAGTETSTYWTGYMDGACRAGERAAREVLAKLPG